jgi:hypothetical protein
MPVDEIQQLIREKRLRLGQDRQAARKSSLAACCLAVGRDDLAAIARRFKVRETDDTSV